MESVPLVVKVACFCLLAQSGVGVDYSFFFVKDFFLDDGALVLKLRYCVPHGYINDKDTKRLFQTRAPPPHTHTHSRWG